MKIYRRKNIVESLHAECSFFFGKPKALGNKFKYGRTIESLTFVLHVDQDQEENYVILCKSFSPHLYSIDLMVCMFVYCFVAE